MRGTRELRREPGRRPAQHVERQSQLLKRVAGAGRGDGLLVEDHGVVSAISDSLCLCRLAKTQVPHATMALEAREPNREVRRSVWTT